MKVDLGVIAVGIAVILFYARLMQIRNRNRKDAREEELARLRAKRRGVTLPPPRNPDQVSYRVGNVYLLVLGSILMLAGLALVTSNILPAMYHPYWWALVVGGMVCFIFCVK